MIPSVWIEKLVEPTYEIHKLGNGLKVVAKTLDKVPLTIELNKVVYWNATNDESFCGFKKLQLCKDQDCEGLHDGSKDMLSLDNNPSVLGDDGLINPKLVIKRENPFNEFINFEASNPFATINPMKNVIMSFVVVCGKEKVVLKDKINKVFDIRGVRSATGEPYSYPLEEIWDLDTTGLAQSKSDCPISKYMICDDDKCLNETAATWPSIENKTLSIDRTAGIALTEKFLAAKTAAGSIQIQPIKILVCGLEEVSVKWTRTMIYRKKVGSRRIIRNVAYWFKNTDLKCPIVRYRVYYWSGKRLRGSDQRIVRLWRGRYLYMRFGTKKDIRFVIKATTRSG